eukprot:NODE_2611_length_906_cov_384.884841.p1 GENE.NODE_2611_length_906_cov_384.884841~~NODE_2611_length_906_cov_384.884841.p1  ORF type:complete len:240 (-),score=69.03 NODE_2611_length_906_cov_384.884841:186-857(-)
MPQVAMEASAEVPAAAAAAVAEAEANAAAEAEATAIAEAKAAAEAEATAAATAAATVAAEEAASERARLAALANGEVTIRYYMYAEKFPIADHKLTVKVIDDVYCLSDVMPKCFIHLATKEFGHDEARVYLHEDPPGTVHDLYAGEVYWCYVQQDPKQEERDLACMRKRREVEGSTGPAKPGGRASEGESCSCIYGNPCVSELVCEDWHNRFDVAKKNGWKGF